MTITYNGQTFPICCTGCRDEFNENPEKYIKKASLMAQSRGTKKAGQPAPTRVGRFEDAFSGDVADAPAMKRGDRPPPRWRRDRPRPRTNRAREADADEPKAASKGKSATRRMSPKAAPPPRRRSGRPACCGSGRTSRRTARPTPRSSYYKRVVKDFADTPAAKTARQRIKALEKP